MHFRWGWELYFTLLKVVRGRVWDKHFETSFLFIFFSYLPLNKVWIKWEFHATMNSVYPLNRHTRVLTLLYLLIIFAFNFWCFALYICQCGEFTIPVDDKNDSSGKNPNELVKLRTYMWQKEKKISTLKWKSHMIREVCQF